MFRERGVEPMETPCLEVQCFEWDLHCSNWVFVSAGWDGPNSNLQRKPDDSVVDRGDWQQLRACVDCWWNFHGWVVVDGRATKELRVPREMLCEMVVPRSTIRECFVDENDRNIRPVTIRRRCRGSLRSACHGFFGIDGIARRVRFLRKHRPTIPSWNDCRRSPFERSGWIWIILPTCSWMRMWIVSCDCTL